MTVEARNTIASVTFTVSPEAEYAINFPFLANPENLSIWYRTSDGSIQYLELNSDIVIDTYDGTDGVYGRAYLNLELDEGTKFTIERDITNDQSTTFTSQTIWSTPMEDALDKLTLIDQDLNFRDQTLRVPASEKITDPDKYELASAEARMNTVLGIKDKDLVYYDVFAGGGLIPATHHTLGLVQIGESLDITEAGKLDAPFASSSRAGIVQIGTGFNVTGEATISVDETKIDEAKDLAETAEGLSETALSEAQASKAESLDAVSEANDAKTKSAEALSLANTSKTEATEALGLMTGLQRTTTATLDLVSEATTDSSTALADVNQKKSSIDTIKANIDAVKALTVQTGSDANTLSTRVTGASSTVSQALTNSANAKNTAESSQIATASALSQVNTEKEHVDTIASDISSIASQVTADKSSVDSIASSISSISSSISTIYSNAQTASTTASQARTSATNFLSRARTEASTPRVNVGSPGWRTGTVSNLVSGNWRAVAYGDGYYVIAPYGNSNVAYSPTGKGDWSYGTGLSANNWYKMAYGTTRDGTTTKRFCVITYNTTTYAYSDNHGSSWIVDSLPFIARCICSGDGVFVVAGNSGASFNEIGNTAWTQNTSTGKLPTGNWEAMAFGNGYFVVAAYGSSYVYRSSDGGFSWSSGTGFQSRNWKAMIFGGGRFLAIPYDSTKTYWSDNNGASWETSSAAYLPFGNWEGGTYGNGRFVLVGHGIIAWSDDGGETWDTASVNGTRYNIAYKDDASTKRFITPQYGGTDVDYMEYGNAETLTIPEAINRLLEGR